MSTAEIVSQVRQGLPDPLPSEAPLYEVVGGERVEVPYMGALENWIASLLSHGLTLYVKGGGLGRVSTETLFLLDPATELQRRPDVAFVSYERWPRDRRVPAEAAWDVVPDLAIEVISPSNLAMEVVKKTQDYLRAGVRSVWNVYAELAMVSVHESPEAARFLGRRDVLEGIAVLPGFRMALEELFEDVEERA